MARKIQLFLGRSPMGSGTMLGVCSTISSTLLHFFTCRGSTHPGFPEHVLLFRLQASVRSLAVRNPEAFSGSYVQWRCGDMKILNISRILHEEGKQRPYLAILHGGRENQSFRNECMNSLTINLIGSNSVERSDYETCQLIASFMDTCVVWENEGETRNQEMGEYRRLFQQRLLSKTFFFTSFSPIAWKAV